MGCIWVAVMEPQGGTEETVAVGLASGLVLEAGLEASCSIYSAQRQSAMVQIRLQGD